MRVHRHAAVGARSIIVGPVSRGTRMRCFVLISLLTVLSLIRLHLQVVNYLLTDADDDEMEHHWNINSSIQNKVDSNHNSANAQSRYHADTAKEKIGPGKQARRKESQSHTIVNETYRRQLEQYQFKTCQELLSAWHSFATGGDWTKDVLHPLSPDKDKLGNFHPGWSGPGLGLQAIESLSTMLLMHNLFSASEHVKNMPQKPYENRWRSRSQPVVPVTTCIANELIDEVINFVSHHVTSGNWLGPAKQISIDQFEMTIRIMGGLLSVYEMTEERRQGLLTGAARLGDLMIDSWIGSTNTNDKQRTQQAIPHNHAHFPNEFPKSRFGTMNLAAFGTLQLEYRTLSFHTKNPKYDMAATWLTEMIDSQCRDDYALCGQFWNMNDGHMKIPKAGRETGLGGGFDSYFEYVVKMYLLTGKKEKHLRDRGVKLLRDLLDDTQHPSLIQFSPDRLRAAIFRLTGVGHDSGYLDRRLDELACFVGGMYALAVMEYDGLSAEDTKLFTETAVGITEQCVQGWFSTPTGLIREMTHFKGQRKSHYGAAKTPTDSRRKWAWRDESNNSDRNGSLTSALKIANVSTNPRYSLRPETIESVYLTFRLTGQEKYREYGMRIFDAVVKHCRLSSGAYVGVEDVMSSNPEHFGSMETFFIAEFLKYATLLFSAPAEKDLSRIGRKYTNAKGHFDLSQWVLNTEAQPLKVRERDPVSVWDEWYKAHDSKVPFCMSPERIGWFRRSETDVNLIARSNLQQYDQDRSRSTRGGGIWPYRKYMVTPSGASLQCAE